MSLACAPASFIGANADLACELASIGGNSSILGVSGSFEDCSFGEMVFDANVVVNFGWNAVEIVLNGRIVGGDVVIVVDGNAENVNAAGARFVGFDAKMVDCVVGNDGTNPVVVSVGGISVTNGVFCCC